MDKGRQSICLQLWLNAKWGLSFASRMGTGGSFVFADAGDDTGTAISTAVN